MNDKTESIRADRLVCTGLVLLGGGVTTLVLAAGLEVDGSAVAPALAVSGLVGLWRLRPTAAGRRARAKRIAA